MLDELWVCLKNMDIIMFCAVIFSSLCSTHTGVAKVEELGILGIERTSFDQDAQGGQENVWKRVSVLRITLALRASGSLAHRGAPASVV